MTKCTQASLRFPGCQGRRVEADFSGGEITGDAGVLLLRQADGVLKLSEAVSRALRDSRRRASCEHASLSLVRQRLYALALGYERPGECGSQGLERTWTSIHARKRHDDRGSICQLRVQREAIESWRP